MSDQHERVEDINNDGHEGADTRTGFVALSGAPNAGD